MDKLPPPWLVWLRRPPGLWASGWLAAALSAGFHLLAFPPFDFPETAYFFALPLLVWIFILRPPRSQVLLVSSFAGWVSWIGLIHWLRHFTTHLEFPGAVPLGWFLMFALAGGVACFWMGWFLAVSWLLPRLREGSAGWRIGGLLGLAAGWVLLEWLRGWLLTGFPWLPLSASQWQRPLLLQVLPYTGAWAVSFLLIFFNLALLFYGRSLLRRDKRPWWQRLSPELYVGLGLIFVAVFLGINAYAAGRNAPKQPLFSAGLAQLYSPPQERYGAEDFRETLQALDDLSRYSAILGAEVVFWPESPIPVRANGSSGVDAWLADLAVRVERPLVIGLMAADPDNPDAVYNAAGVVEPGLPLDFSAVYAKRHLVPFGEYFPLVGSLPFIGQLVPVESGFTAGEAPRSLSFTAGGRRWQVGPLICFEDAFPGLARATVREGVHVLYVATSSVWYGQSAMPEQHAAHSVLRAVETRRPVVRVGNGGWSGWIDEFGLIQGTIAGVDGNTYISQAASFPLSRTVLWAGRLTPYVRYGDWFVGLCALLSLGTWLAFRRRPLA